MQERSLILDDHQVNLRLQRMAWEILEVAGDPCDLVVAGIQGMGHVLAEQLADRIESSGTTSCSLTRIELGRPEKPGDPFTLSQPLDVVADKWVVLVDDVTNTGVTLAHALTPFLQQPTRGISMAVLVDREHHRYPVRADIQGLSLATTLQEHIDVQWDGKAWSVYLS
ncbi:MAG: Bifunctional protein PyrR [Flavobacteriia bacterium]|nr:MAG: Bifunctional protein PyrR [Flavobacteriia bacterium]